MKLWQNLTGFYMYILYSVWNSQCFFSNQQRIWVAVTKCCRLTAFFSTEWWFHGCPETGLAFPLERIVALWSLEAWSSSSRSLAHLGFFSLLPLVSLWPHILLLALWFLKPDTMVMEKCIFTGQKHTGIHALVFIFLRLKGNSTSSY